MFGNDLLIEKVDQKGNINQKRKLHEGTVVTLQKCKNMVIKS